MEDEDPPDDEIRAADEIARRALVFSCVVSVAYGDSREQVLAWLRAEGLLPELSPREQDFLATAEHSKEDVIAFTWMIAEANQHVDTTPVSRPAFRKVRFQPRA